MRRLVACLLLSMGVSHAHAQLPPEQALATMKAGEGLQVELFAAEPMLINPTAIDVDHKGRVWVAEAVNYRRKNFGRPILRKEGDRIQILIDTNGDGKADEAKTFYQGEDLYGPLSVLVLPQADGKSLRVLVAQSPDILEFWDKDGDLKADGPPTKFLSGFGGFDHDHGVHGLTVGPDGKLYFTVGDSGVKDLQSKDGKGKKWTSNTTDVQKGTVWRCDLDGNNLELIAHNFRNNYEACVDSFGEIWLSDNDDDGNQQTRICFVMPGGNYGYGPRGPGQSHWHEEQPGIVHKTLRTGFGSPTGICFYEGTLLPKQYQGDLIHADAGPREIRYFKRKPKGAGYELEKINMLTSSDNWFRPSDVCVAPDGSVFVSDWYDPGVGGHGMGDWTRGRIYRLTPKGHKGYAVPELKLSEKEGMRVAVVSPNLATRAYARNVVRTSSDDPFGDFYFPLLKGDGMSGLKAQAVNAFVQQSENNSPPALMPHLNLYSKYEVLVMLRAVESLASRRNDFTMAVTEGKKLQTDTDLLLLTINKNDVNYARQLLILMRHIKVDSTFTTCMYSLAKLYDGQDHFYRAALNIACGTDPERRDKILADFEKHFPEWNDKVADLVWELRPKSMLPKMEKLLGDAKLTVAQKARIVDILAANDDEAAGKTMLAIVTADHPADVKTRAIDNLKLFLPTKWNSLAKSDELKATIKKLLDDTKSTAVGLQLASAAKYIGAFEGVEKVATDAKASAELRKLAISTLGQLNTVRAPETLEKLLADKAVGVDAMRALGDHISGRSTDSEAAKKAMNVLQSTLEKSDNATLKQAALSALAGSRAGTTWILKQHEDKKFPADLVADAGKLLRNSPFQGERNKAMILFPVMGTKLDPKKLPPSSELAKRKGNVENGKVVLMKSLTSEVQCLKCHMVRGVGGQIGPDLSMIGKKASKENLYDSIIQPSKAIADQYVSWKLESDDGQSITGLLVGETETTLTVRDANGKDYQFPVKGTDRKKSLQSIMPEGLVATLTEQELVDMVEYLTTLQTPSLTPDSWMVMGPFDAPDSATRLKNEYGPENGTFDASATINGRSWRTVRPGANGYVDLVGKDSNSSVSFAYRAIESTEDVEATILLGTDDGAKLYVNGKSVFEIDTTRAAAPAQTSVKVKLTKGKNDVLLKIANGNNPHGFYLTIEGVTVPEKK